MTQLADTPVDFRLMRQELPPIAGIGTEVWAGLRFAHCRYCGYTGRCKAPTQAACPERHGWHRWLERCADHEAWSLPWGR